MPVPICCHLRNYHSLQAVSVTHNLYFSQSLHVHYVVIFSYTHRFFSSICFVFLTGRKCDTFDVFKIIKFYLQEFVKNSSEALKNLEKNRAAKEHPNEGTKLQESTPKKKY